MHFARRSSDLVSVVRVEKVGAPGAALSGGGQSRAVGGLPTKIASDFGTSFGVIHSFES